MCKIPVRGTWQSPLTDFSPRLGPFLVRLTLEKWALSRLTMIFRKNVNVNDPNETYMFKEITRILSQTTTSFYSIIVTLYVIGLTLAYFLDLNLLLVVDVSMNIKVLLD